MTIMNWLLNSTIAPHTLGDFMLRIFILMRCPGHSLRLIMIYLFCSTMSILMRVHLKHSSRR
ncbi:hypothetical protein BDP55DRAFT_368784 [Colletotrichum godetiae]|uniref:Uncharacterized protein n=1 Tax=Colletotrichum godetiae TaxID=1209918 RepID=A0AAJ0A9N2_9PEZI|nr:uncharacterized protein BDP55DRAFT_368784 [Colletotrichum godetiae]KAK1659105.1 hypothetical protein BDP55DRAFT_368784 [Colletotrichum godetiae]